MSNKLLYISIAILFGILLGVSIYIYPELPDQVVSHWNAVGSADGYMSKEFGTFFVPVLFIVLSFLLVLLPKIDPLRENVSLFRREYNIVIFCILFFLAYVHGLTLAWNSGISFDIVRFLVPGIGLLFIVIGLFLPKTKRNWFMGIRTPWTLSSESVWNKTHKAGGVLFLCIGLSFIVSSFLFPRQAFIVFISTTLLGSI